MENLTKYRSRILYSIVAIVAALLLLNVTLIYQNSLIIENNKKNQEDAERAKVNTLDILRNLHSLDNGVRAYALVKNPDFLTTTENAKSDREMVFDSLEKVLTSQHYPNIVELQTLRDSVTSYFLLTDLMIHLIDESKTSEFNSLLNQDRGYGVWLMYIDFSTHINEFEDQIVLKAKHNYARALRNSYLLQALIFILTVPALWYMAFYASRTFRIAIALRVAQQDKNNILRIQNETLDRLVREKTKDIVAQNEEISSKNEEMSWHNHQLILNQNVIENARIIIEEQANIIQRKNNELQIEVETQTSHLRQTNAELVEHNGRLEQFSYIISHNLRGPLARVKGLASLLGNPQSEEEKITIHKLLLQSSQELDTVITDLGQIINIRKLNTEIRSELLLLDIIKKVLNTLASEIHQIKASINIKVDRSESILSLPPYVESIFYNLISNALKYRNPKQALSVDITAKRTDEFLEVIISDNGLGIDLTKYGDQLFNLYKRFHLHVEGKGLGLYLVRTQMEALGGRIEVQSEIDKGTQFTLFFRI